MNDKKIASLLLAIAGVFIMVIALANFDEFMEDISMHFLFFFGAAVGVFGIVCYEKVAKP